MEIIGKTLEAEVTERSNVYGWVRRVRNITTGCGENHGLEKRKRQILSDSHVELYLEDKRDLGVRAGTAVEQVTLSMRLVLRTKKEKELDELKAGKTARDNC